MSDNFNNDDLNKNEEQPWERKFGEDENLKNRQFLVVQEILEGKQ